MTLEQWLDQWTRKPPGVQDRVQLALGFLEKHYGADRKDKGHLPHVPPNISNRC
jgi:hypothetical protein